MSDTGHMVSAMNQPPSHYDVTVTMPRDDGYLPNPAEFAMAALSAKLS